MPEAARKDDPVEHTAAFSAMVAGAVLGALAGLAVVGTGGAALAIAGAVLGGSSLGSAVLDLVAGLFPRHVSGAILAGAPTVFINARPAARAVLDRAGCASGLALCFGAHSLAEGSASVLINDMPAARTGDRGACGFLIGPASIDVWIGGRTKDLGAGREVPLWFSLPMFAAGLVGPGMYLRALKIGWAAIAARIGGGLVGGFAVGFGADAVLGRYLPSDHWGRKLLTFGASFAGAWLGSRLALRFVKLSYPAPTARSEVIAQDAKTAMLEQNVGGGKNRTVGVAVHEDGSVTLATSGTVPRSAPGRRGQLNKGAKMEQIAKDLSDKHKIPVRLAEDLPDEIIRTKLGNHRCCEPKIFAAEPKSRPVAMTVKKVGPGDSPHSIAPGSDTLVPCPTCANNAVHILAERGFLVHDGHLAPVGPAGAEVIDAAREGPGAADQEADEME